MNYEKYLFALIYPGETGNSIVVVHQSKSQVDCLKLHTKGNFNLSFTKKKFKSMIHDNILEIIEKLPNDVFIEIRNTWIKNKDNNNIGNLNCK